MNALSIISKNGIDQPSAASNTSPKVFILNGDGVLTTGQLFYTADGKVMKGFGADDKDGLSLLKHYIEFRFVTCNKNGPAISKN